MKIAQSSESSAKLKLISNHLPVSLFQLLSLSDLPCIGTNGNFRTFQGLDLGYTWTIQQIECATDIMFKQSSNLEPLYGEIVRTAVFTVKPDNITTFLRQRITYNCKKEVGTNYNQLVLGTRIKHHMGDVSIKMYDKFSCVLRIESTCNDIGSFRIKRKVEHRDGSST